MDTLLAAAHERAWAQLSRTADDLEQALMTHQEYRYTLQRPSEIFSPEQRWRDSIAIAIERLRDLRRRIHAHHLEDLRRDLADVIFLSQQAALYAHFYDDEFAEALTILEVESAQLLYDQPSISVATPQLIVSISDTLIAQLAREPHLIHELTPRRFEEVVADLFRRDGFEVQLTQATRDGGVDIIAISHRMNIWEKLIIECKKYAPSNRVGIAVVQRILGVKSQTNANKAVVVTTSSFSKDAQAVARERFWDLDLKAYQNVVAWLRAAVPR